MNKASMYKEDYWSSVVSESEHPSIITGNIADRTVTGTLDRYLHLETEPQDREKEKEK